MANRTPLQAAAATLLLAYSAQGIVVQQLRGMPESSKEPYWQRLRNLIDIQYFGDLNVGSQQISGLFDTGSFELLVFGEQCLTCGKAVGYRHTKSATYVPGNSSETHSFGSGTCYSNDGYEMVQMGPFTAEKMPFWEVVRAQMPVLEQASFQGIVGIGPPGEPAQTAKTLLEDAEKREAEYKTMYGFIPPEIIQQREELVEKVRAESSKLSLLESLGVTTFSNCLGRGAGSAGWLVFNDYDPTTRPEKFIELPVAGKLTWSVQITGMSLIGEGDGNRIPLGCEKGCGAIVDTGTSLFSVPTHVYQKVYDVIKEMNGDCSDLRKFPDLVMHLNGQELRFPPDSYIGQVTGTVPQAMKKLVHASMDVAFGEVIPLDNSMVRLGGGEKADNITVGRKRRQRCQLLLMDMGEELTQLGPLTILGMPFFREFYTTFGIGSKRTIHVARADDQCRPATGEVSLATMRKRQPRKVDAARLRAPSYPRNGEPLTI